MSWPVSANFQSRQYQSSIPYKANITPTPRLWRYVLVTFESAVNGGITVCFDIMWTTLFNVVFAFTQ
jgi:hypothetical protein